MKPYLLLLTAQISLETWHSFENLFDAINQARHDLAGLRSKLDLAKDAAVRQRIRRLLQRLVVDACNAPNWAIPFTQVTLHLAEQEAASLVDGHP